MSVTDSPPYDPDTAAAGLWLLRDAHDQWLADNTEVIGERAGPQPEHVELRLHQHAASVLTWTRALDDLCDGDPEPLLTYRSVRPPMAPLLHGARYACNRSVHQLLTLTRGGYRRPPRFVKQAAAPRTSPPHPGRSRRLSLPPGAPQDHD